MRIFPATASRHTRMRIVFWALMTGFAVEILLFALV